MFMRSIKEKIKYYGFFYPLYPHIVKTGEQPKEEPTTPPADSGDTGDGAVSSGDVEEVGEVPSLFPTKLVARRNPQNKTSAFTYPNSIGPEQDDEFINKEALSSTERMRRYNRRHPEKVRQYLKNTQDDRVARNRDRKKAVKKYGKEKMKNHDVHHPDGPNGGRWKLAKEDHGRDKKNENVEYVYLSELYEGTVPNGPWRLIVEGGAAGHLAHPYEDMELTFLDLRHMIDQSLLGDLKAFEKTDGQQLSFTWKDGQLRLARNKGHLKNRGQNALTKDSIKVMFSDKPQNIQDAFSFAVEDLSNALSKVPSEELNEMFENGKKYIGSIYTIYYKMIK